MSFSFPRFLVFAFVGLPLGFILTALGFAVTETPIVARNIFPWAAGIAVIVGVAGAFWKQAE